MDMDTKILLFLGFNLIPIRNTDDLLKYEEQITNLIKADLRVGLLILYPQQKKFKLWETSHLPWDLEFIGTGDINGRDEYRFKLK